MVEAKTSESADQDVMYGFWGNLAAACPADATLTDRHIAFFIQDGTLYASNADGTTQTKTDITSGITITNNNNYRIIWDNGTNIKYYVNDSLKATHTTNLPSGTTNPPKLYFAIESQSNDDIGLFIKNNYIVKATL